MKNVTLILDDGSRFHGKSFGYEKPVAGEVVFNTAMTGYPESLTDPSYAGQLMTLTYPLVGNYGVPPFSIEPNGLATFMESERIHAEAIIVSDYSQEYSHWNAVESLADWLKREQVPGITGIDTRELTKVLREHGVMMGKIVFDGEQLTVDSGQLTVDNGQLTVDSYENINYVDKVSCKEIIVYANGESRSFSIDLPIAQLNCQLSTVNCQLKRLSMKEMKTQLILFSLLLLGSTAWAQQPCLSQDAYREKVEAYSQILKQQKLKTLASSEARKIAHTGFLPKIDVNADGTLNMSDLSAWNEPVGEYRNHTYQGVFVVSQPLYTGGALNAQHQIAKADEKLNQLNEELTLDQIHYQSDAVYWNASASKAMLQAADKYQSIVKQQYDIIQDRFDDGMISRTDLLMISTRLKEAELQYIKARQNYTLALQQLNILMGEAPNTPVDSLYNIGMISAPVRILPLEDVLQRRADYASTEVNIMKSQAQRKAALSQFNPQLNMYFSGGWATATPNLGYDVSFNPIVGVNLNIPIFRWGARFKTNRQQKAYIGIQKLQQSYMTDNINEELSAALTKLTETESQVKTAKENMSLANENLDLATFSYNEGKASMVDVLSAQLSWTQAHTNLINAYLAEKMAVAEYKKVTSE